MSELTVKAALESALDELLPAIATARENVHFEVPAPDVPYQRVDMLRNTPDNPEIGSGHQLLGILQVSLFYPANAGSGAALTRAQQIRDLFYRGLSITQGGITTTIENTPEIGSGSPDGDRYMVPVRIRWFASIFN